jgi:tRNA 2-selenouridine synthase
LSSSNSHSFYKLADPAEFLSLAESAVLFDVRSPSEFAQGHIPGALNLPLFSDAERAEVGTIYKNSGKESAVLRGLKIAGSKMSDLVIQARQGSSGQGEVLVHCWRGGMRSRSMGWLLSTAGLSPTVLEGGYKSYRAHVHESLESPRRLNVVSGLTGAGKTRILAVLAKAGEQVVDLEGLANHRGSAFGGIGQRDQPTTEQFENYLFGQMQNLNPDQPVWVEDEGNRIGTVVVPPPFYHLMRHSPAIFMDSSPVQRVKNLIEDYGDLPPTELADSISNIRKRLGPQNADEALASLAGGNVARAIEIVLAYYDKTYMKAADAMPRKIMPTLAIDELTDPEIATSAIELSKAATFI